MPLYSPDPKLWCKQGFRVVQGSEKFFLVGIRLEPSLRVTHTVSPLLLLDLGLPFLPTRVVSLRPLPELGPGVSPVLSLFHTYSILTTLDFLLLSQSVRREREVPDLDLQ